MSEKLTKTYHKEIETEITRQAIRCCEGFVAKDSAALNNKVNHFGRQLITDPSADLSFIHGLALTGLRSCGIFTTQS